MPDCHSCPNDGKGDRACIECKGPSDTNHGGQCFVSVEAAVNIKAPELVPTDELDLDPCCCDAVRRILSVFIDINDLDRSLVCHILAGGTPTSWARSRFVTKQSAFTRIKRIIDIHPEFKSILIKRIICV